MPDLVYFAQAERFTDHVAMCRGGRPGVLVRIGGPYQDGPIKIGFTSQIAVRIDAIADRIRQPVAVLGIEDGGQPREVQLHRMFDHLRVGGDRRITTEWFRPASELLNYITSLPALAISLREKPARPIRRVRLGRYASRASQAVAAALKAQDETQIRFAARIAKRLGAAVHRSIISAIVCGNYRPPTRLAAALREDFGFPMAWWQERHAHAHGPAS